MKLLYPFFRYIFASLLISSSALADTSVPQATNDSSAELEAIPTEHSGHTNAFPTGRVDGHAPIGVMGDHIHHAGEWMFSYRFMYMNMAGNRNGSSEVSNASFLAPPMPGRYVVAPLSMDMYMHMFGLMYAPTDDITLMAGFSYQEKTMQNQIANLGMLPPGVRGSTFGVETSGMGDIKLSALFRLYEDESNLLILGQGLSVPTGSIAEQGFVPTFGRNVVLPYPMQLGSGTVDYRPSLTYKGYYEDWSWGAQASAVIRTYKNYHDYQLGNEFDATAWISRVLADWVSVSFRLDFQNWGNIEGADPSIASQAMMGALTTPTAQPDLRGGTRLDVLGGINFLLPKPFEGIGSNRIAIEGGAPVYQYLNGPQLQTNWTITVGWQMSW